jgi:hypothetical protein
VSEWEMAISVVGGALAGSILTATIFRDRRQDRLLVFCREVVDKNDAQLRLLIEQVHIIVAQADELKRLRAQDKREGVTE